jgi:hypothetical protein
MLTRTASRCDGEHPKGKITASKARGETRPDEGIMWFLNKQEEMKASCSFSTSRRK